MSNEVPVKVRVRLGRALILVGVLASVPYAVLRYGLGRDIAMAPFLAVHLAEVIPGRCCPAGTRCAGSSDAATRVPILKADAVFPLETRIKNDSWLSVAVRHSADRTGTGSFVRGPVDMCSVSAYAKWGATFAFA
jgi:hypothetical protein